MNILTRLAKFAAGTDKSVDAKSKNVKEQSMERSMYYEPSHAWPYNPAALFQKANGYRLYDQALEDDTVDAMLEFKLNLILGSGFSVESDDEKVREFWEYALNDGYDGNFRQSMRKVLSAIPYGFSVTEKVHGPIEFNGKQYWSIKKLKTRPPHGMRLETNEYGDLERIVQESAGKDNHDIILDPVNFILFSYRPRFDNPYGHGDITPGMYRNTFSKKQIIKYLNIAIERYAVPTAVGKHPKNTDSNDIDTLFDIVKNLSAKAAVTLSEEFDITLLEAKNLSDLFIQAIDMYNLAIARGFLISDLAGLSGKQMAGGGLGGNLGDVQFQVMMEMFRRTAKDLENHVNREIIQPLTAYNFGKKAYAVFKFDDLTRRQKEKAAELFMKYMEKGGQPTNEQEIWLMQQIGAPAGELEERHDDEDDTEKNSPDPSTDSGGDKDNGSDQGNGTNPPGDGGGLLPETKEYAEFMENKYPGYYADSYQARKYMKDKCEKCGSSKYLAAHHKDGNRKNNTASNIMTLCVKCHRLLHAKSDKRKFALGAGSIKAWDGENKVSASQLTPYELRVNFSQIDTRTREGANGYQAKLEAAVKQVQLAFYEMLKKRRIVDLKKFALLRQLKIPSMHLVRGVFEEMLKDGIAAGDEIATGETKRRGQFAAEDAQAAIVAKEIVDEWRKSKVFSLTKSISEDMLKSAENVLADAMRNGSSTRETITLLDKTLEGTVGKAKLEMIARTNYMSAFTQGRMQGFKKAPGIVGMQWSAILDGRTSDICESLHGKIVRPGETSNYPMPAHPNCRSVWVAVFEEDIEGQKESDVFGGMPNVEKSGGFMKLIKPK